MNKEYDFLMRNASCALILAEQAQCISLLISSGKLSEDESGIIETILQEKFRALIDTSSSIQSSIAFDFPLKNEINTETQDVASKNTFGDRLKFALKEQGMTQAELAKSVGVSQSTISQVVNGKVSGVCRTSVIAKALGINRNWLAYGEGEMLKAQPESFELKAARIKFSDSNL
ncbi:helix-turn-helix domain-containing protein [Providencia stuartii]|uniref:helix-turn-helix domain-containing protein n=1 Tax=Providencia stuartii TaxID=588 RepID=UPI0023B187A3|nr:helix-turn-helix transcriptional regulator [Providencia thailandensis]MDE8747567.1 helix-turn-helix transcriptional regulator [Providencia thailandensis]MDE8766573.1 helix-turn-helix transcriptional regulator [Providencia thailandensis]MDE8778612.1 helix-turn-helix transcriptional regulator [Providencia thailandensis]MDE8783038.1 helix-turn-helix transcriptional regulator [Providencia thailandensis]MDE8787032.1 helix-turn-helix transcriptional regulator [Providencia thailandensis]